MRILRLFLLLLPALLLTALPALASEISGSFKITEGDRVIGAEKFNVVFESDDQVTIDTHGSTKHGDDDVKDYSRLIMRTLEGPIHSYQREVYLSQLPQGLVANYAGGELLIEAREGPRKTDYKLQVSAATMVVDVGVWSHLHLLIHRYSHRVGGEQRFVVAVPSELRVVDPVFLRHIGREAVALGNGYFMANKYFFNRRDVGMIVWADKNGAILRVESPMQNLVVERIKYDGERAEEVNPVKRIGGDVHTELVVVESGDVKLAGLFTKPRGIEGRVPALVFLSDSGPHDRNGDSAVGNINIGTGELLDKISAAGFAVIRLDDRGVGESGGDMAQSTLAVQALDAMAQVEFLKQRPDIDTSRIGLIGQGEGANVAIMVAAKFPEVKALVLLSPSDVPLSDLAIEQIKHRVKLEGRRDPGAWERHPVVKMMQMAKERPDQKFFAFGGKSIYLDTYREWFAMRPVADLAAAKAKVLHLQPGKDLQVFPEHARGFREVLANDPRYTYKEFGDLNHLFMPSVGTVGEYADPTLKVDPDVAKYISGWLKANL
jgi:pimeloyl-ACP methyl ester carboxylesterase